VNPPRPNIVLITCHDLGTHLPSYGIKTVQAPRLESLAQQGVCFENVFCTAPQCSPSRASLFTGLYPHRTGVLGLCHGDFAWEMADAHFHLARRLAGAGYATAGIGVIHEVHSVERIGFDRVLATPNGFAPEIAESASRYIAEAGDRPYYLQVGFIEPHRGFDFGGARPDRLLGVTIPPYLRDEESAREEFAGFQGAIRQLDSAVGTILDAVDRSGHAENTIFIFTTDHGIPFPRAKCSLYDPGLRTALLVR
jgi:N-sulfoglucosamine sulfohydrolase